MKSKTESVNLLIALGLLLTLTTLSDSDAPVTLPSEFRFRLPPTLC